jgi:hypothetical protein
MTIPVMQLKWVEYRQNTIAWLNKRRNEKLARTERARERSIRILQNRYGYTKEQATAELGKHYSKAWLG